MLGICNGLFLESRPLLKSMMIVVIIQKEKKDAEGIKHRCNKREREKPRYITKQD